MVAIRDHTYESPFIPKKNKPELDTFIDGYDRNKSTNAPNTTSEVSNKLRGLENSLRYELEEPISRDTEGRKEDQRDDVELTDEVTETHERIHIGDHLYRLSAKRQIEGKKIREAAQNKNKSDEIPPLVSYPSAKASGHYPNQGLCDWLYGLSTQRQMEGKNKRQSVEAKLSGRNLPNSGPNKNKAPIKFDINGIIRKKAPIQFDINGIIRTPKSKKTQEKKEVSANGAPDIFDRLSRCAHCAQKKEEGKKKKESIEAAIKARHPDPKEYPLLPPSMHSYYYEKNVKYAIEREERINKLIEKRDLEIKMEIERRRRLKEKRELKRMKMYGISH